jgi:hypothetical protein
MTLRKRLQRLEREIPDPGCPACRDRRGRHIFVTARRQPDGTLTYPEGGPAPCGVCGVVPEFVIEVVEVVVESREDVRRLGQDGWEGV